MLHDTIPPQELPFEQFIKMGLEGQQAILEDMLKAGVPLVTQDSSGRFIQKNPDGTVQYATLEQWKGRR